MHIFGELGDMRNMGVLYIANQNKFRKLHTLKAQSPNK